jgi:hypothetical protein
MSDPADKTPQELPEQPAKDTLGSDFFIEPRTSVNLSEIVEDPSTVVLPNPDLSEGLKTDRTGSSMHKKPLDSRN